jgi:hypothetical protein
LKPTIKLDASQWNNAARELFETSSRSCTDFINGQALRVAIESVRQTEGANAQEVARILGATGQSVSFHQITRGKNKGSIRLKKGALTSGSDSFAKRILLSRKNATGSWGIKGQSMQDKVSNFIKARMASVNFIKAGWIPARNILFGVVKQKPANARSVAGVKKRGKDKGSAKPAVFSLRSTINAEISNTALMEHVKRGISPGGNPMPVAEKGLQRALNLCAQDMIQKLAERLNPDFKKVSAK